MRSWPRNPFGWLIIGTLYGAAVSIAVIDSTTEMNGFGFGLTSIILALLAVLLGVLTGLFFDVLTPPMAAGRRNLAIWILAIGALLYALVRPALQVARE